MEIPRSVRHPIETIRTAPVGLAEIAIGSGIATPFIVDAILNPEPANIYSAVSAGAIGLVGLARIGVHSIGRQFHIRNQTETLTAKIGFPDYYLEGHTHYWCDRQTIQNVYRNDPDNLAAYRDLCDKSRTKPAFPWLPHF